MWTLRDAAMGSAPSARIPRPIDVHPAPARSQQNIWQIGAKIAAGSEATVFHAVGQHGKVVKVFSAEVAKTDIQREATTLNRFYGEGFSQLSPCGTRILMPLLPGRPLHEIPEHHKTPALYGQVMDCLQKMVSLGIFPEDLCEANFLYDTGSASIWPVDLKCVGARRAATADFKEAFKGAITNLAHVSTRTSAQPPEKHIQFVMPHRSTTVSTSAHAVASRTLPDVGQLEATRTLVKLGSPVPATQARRALLSILALNSELQFLSQASEDTLAKRIDTLGLPKGKWHRGDAGYLLLEATLSAMLKGLRT